MKRNGLLRNRQLWLLLAFFLLFYLLQQPAVFFQTMPDERGLYEASLALAEGAVDFPAMSSLLAILAVPFVYLGKLMSVLMADPLLLKLTVNSTNVFLALILLAVFYKTSDRFFPSPFPLVLTFFLGAGTSVNFYAVHFFNEILAGLFLIVPFLLLLKSEEKPHFVTLAGVVVSLSQLNRIDGFLVALPCLLYIVLEFPRRWKHFMLGMALGILPVVGFWYGVTGLTPDTAYQGESFSNPLWVGLYGFLFSPGRSIFIYAPVLILSVLGFPAFYRRYRSEALYILSAVSVYFVMYSVFWNWVTPWGWGPRYMVKLFPLLMIPSGTILYRTARSVVWSVVVTFLGIVSVLIQLLSTASNYQNSLNLILEVMGYSEVQSVTNPYLSQILWQWYDWRITGGFQSFSWSHGYSITGFVTVAVCLLVGLFLFFRSFNTKNKWIRPWTAISTLLFIFLGITVAYLNTLGHGLRRTVIAENGSEQTRAVKSQNLDPYLEYRPGQNTSPTKYVIWKGEIYLPNHFVYKFGMITNGTTIVNMNGEEILRYVSAKGSSNAQFIRSDKLRYDAGWYKLTIIHKGSQRPFFQFLYFPLNEFWKKPPVSYLRPTTD